MGKFTANWLGLYDMGGNVWQWCEDEYQASMNDADVLKKHPVLLNETAFDATTFSKVRGRVVRGAAWYNGDQLSLHSSFHTYIPPSSRSDSGGFRCVVESPR